MDNKKEIVKMLLKDKKLNIKDEEELLEILFSEKVVIDVDKQMEDSEKWTDRLADKITSIAGSWGFIISSIFVLLGWVFLNICLEKTNDAFDPYPFILLNLTLSCIAALQAPIIMMSQNRSAKRDTLRSKNDYKADLKSQLILEELYELIKEMNDKLDKK